MLYDHSLQYGLTSSQEELIGHLVHHLPTGLTRTIMPAEFHTGKLTSSPVLKDTPLWNTSQMLKKFEKLDNRSALVIEIEIQRRERRAVAGKAD